MSKNSYREIYENGNLINPMVVDDIFNVVREYCKSNNIEIAMDDRAENFVTAITEYLVESKGSNIEYKYSVLPDAEGHYILIKYVNIDDTNAKVIDIVDRKDYPNKEDIDKYFSEKHNVKIGESRY